MSFLFPCIGEIGMVRLTLRAASCCRGWRFDPVGDLGRRRHLDEADRLPLLTRMIHFCDSLKHGGASAM